MINFKKQYILLLILLINTIVIASSEVILKLDTSGHSSLIRDIIVTKSGDIISASEDKTIRIWDSKTGKEKRKILGQIGVGGEGMVYAIALSKNEKYLAVGGFMGSFTGKKSRENEESNKIRIYNYKTGKLLKILKSHTNVVMDLDFSEDNKFLISGSQDNTSKIWDIDKEFSLNKTIKFHSDHVYATKIFKTNNKYYAITASLDGKVMLYDIKNNKLVNSYDAKYKLTFLAYNGKHIAVCGESNEIIIFDTNLNLIKFISTDNKPQGLKYNKNGDFLLVGNGLYPYNINIYKSQNNYKHYKTFKGNTNFVRAIDFIHNGSKLFIISGGGNNNEIKIWNINDQNSIVKSIKGVGQEIFQVGVDKNYIAFGTKVNYKDHNSKASIEKLINLNNFNISSIDRLKYTSKYSPISTTRGNYTLEHRKGRKYGFPDEVLLVKYKNKSVSKIIKNPYNGYRHRCYGWYKDYIISGGNNGNLIVYNKKGEIIASLLGHTGIIWSINIHKNILVSGSSDQTIKLWDLNKLKNKVIYNEKYITSIMSKYNYSRNKVLSLAQKRGINNIYSPQKLSSMLNLFISKDNEYVAWTKDGFFDASKNGAKYIGYHINQGPNKEAEFVTVDALYDTFYRPDLIQKALKGEDLSRYAKNINIQKLLKDGLAPEVHILSKTKNTKNQDMDLKVQVCPKNKGGYNNLTLTINDTPVSVIDTSRALKLKKKSKRDDCFIYNQTISLLGGKNTIGFKATNKAGNIESKPDFLEVTFDDTKLKNKLRNKLSKLSGDQNINDLHILAIAVNEYKDNELKLNYSINDATQMLKTIQKVSKPLFNKVHTYKLFDKDVTKQNIKDIFKTIKSTREDVFLLYIAGHGITDEYNGNYYYIPYDFISKDDEKAVQKQGVGQRDLILGLSKITALKSLVLLDTCNSGSFVEANMQKTTTNRLAKATGRATISASSKSQVALEGFNNHGVFTYTLLEALKGKGYNGDNKITTNELSDYVEYILPSRTYEKWGYKQVPQKSMFGVDFNIGVK